MPIARRVVLDACVLYPPSLRDLLLTLAALDAYDVAWSEQILTELERNVLADHPDINPDRFQSHTIAAMRNAFPNATTATGPSDKSELRGVNRDDRHVAATALAANADAIITINTRHFPTSALAPLRIAVITPGALITELNATEPELIDHALTSLAERWINPPRSVDEIVTLLRIHPTMRAAINAIRARHHHR